MNKSATEKVENIKINELMPFENQPFKIRLGEERDKLLASIKDTGIITPLIVRPIEDGQYEIISGFRRLEICNELGIETIPVIVRNMTNDEAVIAMVDANLQRENVLPSERAFAYKMKMDALKHQGKVFTSSQLAAKLRTDDSIGKTFGVSGDTIQRYIRLTYLVPELLTMVDERKIAFTPAVELSFLSKEEQLNLVGEIEYADATPSLSQAQHLREMSRMGRLSRDAIFGIISEEKPNQKEQLRFRTEDIKKYFPKHYTNSDMQKTIMTLLEKWQRQRERNNRGDR